MVNDPMFKKLNDIIDAHDSTETVDPVSTIETRTQVATPSESTLAEPEQMLNSIRKSLEGILQNNFENDDEVLENGSRLNPKVAGILKTTLDQLEEHTINAEGIKNQFNSEKIESSDPNYFDENAIELTDSEAPLSSNIDSAQHISKRLQIAKDMNLLQQVIKVDERNVKYLKYLENTRENKTLSKQLPNMIIVGAKKCGTGALSSFLDIHPKAHYAGEVYYFNREIDTKSVKWYESKMPMSPAGDVVFEKTPDYFFQADIGGGF